MLFGDAAVIKTPLGYDISIPVSEFEQKKSDIMGFSISDMNYREGGLKLDDNWQWTLHVSMAEGELGEVMTLHFFDWEKQPVGDIEFTLLK